MLSAWMDMHEMLVISARLRQWAATWYTYMASKAFLRVSWPQEGWSYANSLHAEYGLRWTTHIQCFHTHSPSAQSNEAIFERQVKRSILPECANKCGVSTQQTASKVNAVLISGSVLPLHSTYRPRPVSWYTNRDWGMFREWYDRAPRGVLSAICVVL